MASAQSQQQSSQSEVLAMREQVKEVDVWLRITKSRGLKFSGEHSDWPRFSKDFKTLMSSLNPISARIIRNMEKITVFT